MFARDGLLNELKKALAERILNAEMDQNLAAERADAVTGEPRNHRNGLSRKIVLTGTGKLDLQVPRDRQANFEPPLAKYRRRRRRFFIPIGVAGRHPGACAMELDAMRMPQTA